MLILLWLPLSCIAEISCRLLAAISGGFAIEGEVFGDDGSELEWTVVGLIVVGFVGVDVVELVGDEVSWLLCCENCLFGSGILSVGAAPEFACDGLKGTETGKTPGLVW